MTNSNTLYLALKCILNDLLSKCTNFHGSFLICDAKNSIEGCKLTPIQYTVTKTVFKMHISINHCFFPHIRLESDTFFIIRLKIR